MNKKFSTNQFVEISEKKFNFTIIKIDENGDISNEQIPGLELVAFQDDDGRIIIAEHLADKNGHPICNTNFFQVVDVGNMILGKA